MKKKFLQTACLIAVLFPAVVKAGTVYWSGAVGSGLTGNFTLNYNFSANTVVVDITNTTVGPTSVAQNVSGVEIFLSGGLVGTLNSVTGQLANVAGDGTFANTSGTPDWYQPLLTSNLVTGLGSSGPDNTLLGKPCVPSGTYGCSNNSITGNGPHNPFAVGMLQYVLNVPGATSATELTGLKVAFGTGPTWVNVPTQGSEVGIPEPSPFLLVGAPLAYLLSGVALRRGQNLG